MREAVCKMEDTAEPRTLECWGLGDVSNRLEGMKLTLGANRSMPGDVIDRAVFGRSRSARRL